MKHVGTAESNMSAWSHFPCDTASLLAAAGPRHGPLHLQTLRLQVLVDSRRIPAVNAGCDASAYGTGFSCLQPTWTKIALIRRTRKVSNCKLPDRSLTDGEQQEQTLRLFDLPPEVWIKCCRFAVLWPDCIRIEGRSGIKQILARFVPPPITRICRIICEETLRVWYGENDFRFVDDHRPMHGLCSWVRDGWTTHWPMAKHCTIESDEPFVQQHLHEIFRDKVLSFSAGPPEREKSETAVLALTVKERGAMISESQTEVEVEEEEETKR